VTEPPSDRQELVASKGRNHELEKGVEASFNAKKPKGCGEKSFREIKEVSKASQRKFLKKCIRVKPEKVKMVVGQDVGLEEVEDLMERTLVG